jgi:hypothetical protein
MPSCCLTQPTKIDNNLISLHIKKGHPMKKGSMEDQILRASKEIVVKFIEVGRLSPTTFAETFKIVYHTIDETVHGESLNATEPEPGP